MRAYRWRVVRHTAGFARRYRRTLSPTQLAVALGESLMGLGGRRRYPRTHVTTTEPLDDVYTPAFPPRSTRPISGRPWSPTRSESLRTRSQTRACWTAPGALRRYARSRGSEYGLDN